MLAPAGILAAVAFIMSRQYGSKQIGGMIIAGGVIMFVGMFVCYTMVDKIDERYITGSVTICSNFVYGFICNSCYGSWCFFKRIKKKRPKKEFSRNDQILIHLHYA